MHISLAHLHLMHFENSDIMSHLSLSYNYLFIFESSAALDCNHVVSLSNWTSCCRYCFCYSAQFHRPNRRHHVYMYIIVKEE